MTANDLGGKSETAGEGSVENGGGDVQVVESPTVPAPTSVDLDAIRARCEAATPGPWVRALHPNGYHVEGVLVPLPLKPENRRQIVFLGHQRDMDADFIAHARADIPALLVALDDAHGARDNAASEADYFRAREAHALDERDRLQELVDEDKAAYDELADRLANLEWATGVDASPRGDELGVMGLAD